MRAEVFPKPELPGHAVLRLYGTDASPEGMTLLIERRQGPDRFLSETGWQRTESWLQPQRIDAFNGGLDLHVGPRVCDLVAGMTVRLAIREPDVGMVDTTVAAWPAMQTSGAHDPDRQASDSVAGRTDKELRQARPRDEQATVIAARPVLPEPEPEPEASPFIEPTLPAAFTPQPDPLERPSVLSQREAPKSSLPLVLGLVFGLLFLIVAAGGAYWWFVLRDKAPVVDKPIDKPIDKPTGKTGQDSAQGKPDYTTPIRKQVEDILAAKPTPEQLVEHGKRFLRNGQLEGAFLVWRTAADQGHPPAAFELAGFYDPVNPIPHTPFPLNAERAAGLYETAAKAGIVPAMARLGMLYAQGADGFPADKAKARDWLKQAADKGDADARKALDTL
ncbi:MAG: sel1 repeat family protein [Alphaproteobacteria bacterium]|nr:sel1 repeat family protein [Alphaproteobacteria bacterium]MCW5744495.1 sel1 repeat family protein [Alphaproteobacteria bacterium]